MAHFQTIHPATGEVLKSYQHLSWSDAEKILIRANQDFQIWRKSSFAQRVQALLKLADNLSHQKKTLAALISSEMGKAPGEALAEIDKSILACRYYAEKGESLLAPQELASNYESSEVIFRALGPLVSIMPWNFPLWQVIRFAAPALMAGNVILLKHADLTAGSAELIAECFKDLHPSLTLLHNLQVDHEVCAQLIQHPFVRGVTFTGSTRGGQEVAKVAASVVKKTVLELGGSDAYVVFADADLEQAAKISAAARLMNCGQSCVAAKRFIVVQEVAEKFTDLFKKELQKIELSSLAHKKFQIQLQKQVETLKQAGGDVLLGGKAPEGPGAFYPATLIRFKENPRVLESEELFGPVASLIIAQNESDALKIANSSDFGLGGALFTKDLAKGQKILAEDFEAGFVVLNDQVKSDPRLPFGGVKFSGYGRELGPFGIHEFVNVKTVARAKASL